MYLCLNKFKQIKTSCNWNELFTHQRKKFPSQVSEYKYFNFIINRDLRAENLLVFLLFFTSHFQKVKLKPLTIKISDFGLSKILVGENKTYMSKKPVAICWQSHVILKIFIE